MSPDDGSKHGENEITEAVISFAIDREHTLDWSVSLAEQLSDYERPLFLAVYLDMEVNNGGFAQWLCNDSGTYWKETVQCLSDVGATDTVALIQAAVAVFPDGEPPEDLEERHRQLSAMPRETREGLWHLDDQYYEIRDDLFVILHRHMTENAPETE